ncbi:Thiamine-monophosphate kinase [Rosistilla carotiformis]|uniref:Thiamine-monophosphate kinase n=1 Tax=Rosistilla carotiformis TaxID=2528017 RepID=A0A518JNY0_9BACT|nr:thiamine-phosphate kinase [Rosistilla carotiformis]QDV67221.1 Thiamine-monophosphate kinase [Rosistilla carotiformis]
MEQSFLAWLRGRQRDLPQVAVGIGDDAAILDWPSSRQLVTSVDTIVDGVDFLLDKHSLASIGHKALAVNLSDMAAMAADPVAVLVAISLPNQQATQVAAGIYEGILATAAEFGVAISGGDITVYDGPLAISITIIGQAAPQKAWLRSGAEPDDAVLVSGSLGGSILQKHLAFTPRVRLAQQLRDSFTIHAAIDISDGLLLDLDRLCAASGCGIELQLDQIPISDDAKTLSLQDGGDPLEHALGDGEDYELILTCPAEQAADILAADLGTPLTQIGVLTSRTGLWSKLPNKLIRLSPRGFVHGG